MVIGEIGNHWDFLVATGELKRRRVARARREIEALALASVQRRFADLDAGLDDLAEKVESGELDPFAAADLLLDD